MDYEAAYASLEGRKPLRDRWYDVGLMLFHQLLNDGKWEQPNEYTFTRKREGGKPLTINLRSDTLYGEGPPRSDGLDYLVNMLEANGGTLDGIQPQPVQVKGKLRLRPPYKIASLTAQELVWHKTMPPEREQLQEIVRYDEEIGRLYWVVETDLGQYEDGVTVAPAHFIDIGGVKCARWRVISQLLFNNPKGIEDLEECRKVLKNMPTGEAAWKQFRALNKAYTEHMNERGPNYRERKHPRLTAKIRQERAELEADQAELGKLRQQRAGVQRQIQIVTEKIEKEKETGPTRKPLSRRARLDAYFASLKEKT